MNEYEAAEEEIIAFIAESMVDGVPAQNREIAARFLQTRGIETDPAVTILVHKGISAFARDKRAEDRIRFKTLELDPEFYARIAKRIAAHESKPAVVAKRERAEQLIQERTQKLSDQLAPAFRKMKLAMEFYDRWTLPDGTALGDATRSKLLAEASRERATADGHIKNATLYEALADSMHGDQTVREMVPLDQAHRLREQIFASSVPALVAAE